MGGNEYSIEWGGNRTELAPDGARLSVECYVPTADAWGKHAIGCQAYAVSGDRVKFISYVSYARSDDKFIVKFVIGTNTYSATFIYTLTADTVAKATLSIPSRMTIDTTYGSYRRSLITINVGEGVMFSYDIELYASNGRGVALHASRVRGIYNNEFRYHVVAAPSNSSCPRLVAFSHTDVLGGGTCEKASFDLSKVTPLMSGRSPST